ncbi:MAG: hypothetical protein ACKOCB_06110 [Planctomycetia bacterium]
MSGSGGYKHRLKRKKAKRRQVLLKVRAMIARRRNEAEAKGQTWDPAQESGQLTKLNHAARHEVIKRAKSG